MKGFTDFFLMIKVLSIDLMQKYSMIYFFFEKELFFFFNASEICLMAKLWLYQCKLGANLN